MPQTAHNKPVTSKLSRISELAGSVKTRPEIGWVRFGLLPAVFYYNTPVKGVILPLSRSVGLAWTSFAQGSDLGPSFLEDRQEAVRLCELNTELPMPPYLDIPFTPQ